MIVNEDLSFRATFDAFVVLREKFTFVACYLTRPALVIGVGVEGHTCVCVGVRMCGGGGGYCVGRVTKGAQRDGETFVET